jgi:hypothetical protein
MKLRIIVLMMLTALVFVSCKKDKEDNSALTQDVSFSAIQIDPSAGLKGTNDWQCPTDANGNLKVPTVAKVLIQGFAEPFWPQVFTIDNVLYTQSIKLPVTGNSQVYTIEFFGLFTAVDGELIMATPEALSDFAVYTSTDVDFEITVSKFAKAEIPVEVLCFMPESYNYFGFDWFTVDEIVIRNQCFFGDFCMKHPADYLGSSYANQSTGLQLDMPAIFKIDVSKEVQGEYFEVPYNPTFNNNNAEANWGVGAPVCIQYPDNLMIDGETFRAQLWILVKVGSAFEYKLFHTWYFDDEEVIPAGTDGVVDFVLGSCNLSNTDLQLAPYQNLPATCSLITGGSSPGSLGTYFDVTLSGIPAGYDISNMAYGVFCADQGSTIYLNTPYSDMGVYSSLLPHLLPGGIETKVKNNLDMANWLMNNLGNYNGETWQDIQNAIWIILDNDPPTGAGTPTALANQMATDAMANGNNFVPLPGGWAAVVFYKLPTIQLIFTVVDP